MSSQLMDLDPFLFLLLKLRSFNLNAVAEFLLASLSSLRSQSFLMYKWPYNAKRHFMSIPLFDLSAVWAK